MKETEPFCIDDMTYRDRATILARVRLLVEVLNEKLHPSWIEVVDYPPSSVFFRVHAVSIGTDSGAD